MKLIIKKYRIFRGLTLSTLSGYTNLSAAFLSDLENHKRLCSLKSLQIIAHALEVCPKALIKCDKHDCKFCTHKDEVKHESSDL